MLHMYFLRLAVDLWGFPLTAPVTFHVYIWHSGSVGGIVIFVYTDINFQSL